MASGWAAAAASLTAALPPLESPPFHTGYAPNPPVGTLAPFVFDGTEAATAGPVSADLAVQVPAASRALSIIAGTVAAFPLEEWRAGRRVTPRRALLSQPDPDTTRQVTVTRTVEDMALHGVGYWLVIDRDPDSGKPRHARHCDAATVVPDEQGRQTIAGKVIPARDLIRFDHDRYGILHRAARILRIAIALEQAAGNYARNPAPRTILSAQGDVILTADEQRRLVDDYEALARRRSTAYVQNVKPEQVGWSSSELQLTEARQYTAAQTALAMNLDPIWCGANQPGSSLTYTNRQDLYRALIDVTLRSYLANIEQRLSADDVTERGRVVRFDLDGFLRGNAGERADLAVKLLDAGVLDIDTARRIVDLTPPEEVTP